MNDNIPLSKVILRNSFFRTANFTVKFAVAFFITPYMVLRLGMELFGVWTILSVVVTYAHLADMGIGRTLIIFVSKYKDRKFIATSVYCQLRANDIWQIKGNKIWAIIMTSLTIENQFHGIHVIVMSKWRFY